MMVLCYIVAVLSLIGVVYCAGTLLYGLVNGDIRKEYVVVGYTAEWEPVYDEVWVYGTRRN